MNNIIDFLNLPVRYETDFLLCTDKEKSYSYNEFMEKALYLADYIVEKNIKNKPIGVHASHDVDTLVKFTAVLLSGNYYVPISDEAPESFIEKIKEQIDMVAFLQEFPKTGNDKQIEQKNNKAVEQKAGKNVEQNNKVAEQEADKNIEQEDNKNAEQKVLDKISKKLKIWRKDIGEDSPLYIIFTSGSTGVPKGILKSHGNMIDFIQAYQNEFKFDENTVLGNQAPFYFDASAKDIYTMLYAKSKLHILDA